jgi:hypothetical protein
MAGRISFPPAPSRASALSLALSIRQPYAELILRGAKSAEYRSRATKIVGERFWIYAAKGTGSCPTPRPKVKPWSTDLAVPGDDFPADMIELANALRLFPHELPRGVIVGSAVISHVEQLAENVDTTENSINGGHVTRGDSSRARSTSTLPPPLYAWHLTDVERLETPFTPKGHPQPVWWRIG